VESISRHAVTTNIPSIEGLPDNRNDWPRNAEQSFSEVLRELDRWSRENGCPMITNSWIAEEAVRQSW